ncbi:uncharacterized protein LOC132067100 [Lycium ferocissimum]|uniref:uncharacterized protein LOC132067100 n=1 Tax=Lycium ferocissimum TaxID=112874 RepID=UPI0028158416|nr:uncharacterized protein LOC132067100 [Lycium ferocissimum]
MSIASFESTDVTVYKKKRPKLLQILLVMGYSKERTPQEGNNVSGDSYPLCRRHIEGWIVVEAVRNFMNSKKRSCALETCNFTGNYAELRKHARHEHPFERPSEADPTRQSDWTRLELQRDFGDAFSAYQAPSDHDDSSGDDFLPELPPHGGLVELSVSLPTGFLSMPWERDGSPSYALGGYTVIVSESGSRS